jgi:uncharacterized 2Fe-2S/4Fe-4S cluster protein (DUF4445 family)
LIKVQFLPENKTVTVPAGTTILQAAIGAGVQIESTCGGRGTCGKCKVEKGSLNLSGSTVEQVLACQTALEEDIFIITKENEEVSDRKINLGLGKEVAINTSIAKHFLSVPTPSLENPIPDWERLKGLLPNKTMIFRPSLVSKLPNLLRANNHKVTVVMDSESLIAIEPGDTRGRTFGLAIDLGTTTLVAHLINLETGKVIASRATTNSQNVFGADVISRITYAGKGHDELKELQDRVINSLNSVIQDLGKVSGVDITEIYQTVVVGNTTMAHLFLGIDPTYLAPAPFTPAFSQEVEVEARELGLAMLSTGKVIVLPNIGGYVGSDTVGVMISTEVDKLKGNNLIIDIGTNGELVLMGQGRILTCSTAAGPAFEGAEIKFGMRAQKGAIEGVKIADDVKLTIIGSSKAQGICGSGLIDAVAEMVRVGIIDRSGRFIKTDQLDRLPPLLASRVRNVDKGAEFVLVWAKDTVIGEDIVLTQKDIRELQLAKGAIVAGTKILLKTLGIGVNDLDQVLLAGAFGNYIKVESAQGMGLLPPIPLEKINSIGNAASEGAKMVLLSTRERARSMTLAKKVEHMELSAHREFQELFIQSLSLGNVY